jgi:hypothetical protein
MSAEFSAQVQETMGPLLEGLGFVVDEVDDRPDKGGRRRHIVYYRSSDCKLQVYESSREGEFNCMIAPLDATNAFGLDTKKWQFLTRFSDRPDVPLAELAAQARAEYESYTNPLEWVRDRIANYYQAAHSGILKMYGAG